MPSRMGGDDEKIAVLDPFADGRDDARFAYDTGRRRGFATNGETLAGRRE